MADVSHRVGANCALLTQVCYRERLDTIPEGGSELSFGNSVYKIRFEDRDERPLYGHRYWFYLKDAVEDVPEYVVHWDSFVKLVPVRALGCHETKRIATGWPLNMTLTWFTRKNSMKYTPRMKNTQSTDLCCNI